MLRDDMLARANSVCLVALSRSDLRVLALVLVRVDCAVARCACGAKKAENQKGSRKNDITVGNNRLRRAERWENMPSMSSEVGEIYWKSIRT